MNINNVIAPVGPRNSPKIAVVGDYATEEEARTGVPFTGKDEGLFKTLLTQAGIERRECYLTKVFLEKPLFRDMSDWTMTKTELKAAGLPAVGKPVIKASHLIPSKFEAVARLHAELAKVKPNIVLALGTIPLWALYDDRSVMKNRGSIFMSTAVKGQKVLATYEVNRLFSQWDLFPIISTDFTKAARHSHTRENIVPSRKIWIKPTLADIEQYICEHIETEDGEIAVDIETQQGQITCIGFASSRRSAIVIPFWKTKTPAHLRDFHYWPTAAEEVAAMRLCKRILDHPRPKVFQNGMYDITYIWKVWGMPIRNPREDTMLLHHSIQPELLKGLGFLGSIYTDEPSWKGMRKAAMDTEKRDE